MEIVKVTESNICEAGKIHSTSWKESHRSFCSAEFVARHTEEAQTEYIRSEIAGGKDFYMLIDAEPVGIVSVHGGMIENLYVLPEEQRKGYGSRLLHHAIRQCEGAAMLWVLNTNAAACRLYQKNGFRVTGNRKELKNGMYEAEMKRCAEAL